MDRWALVYIPLEATVLLFPVPTECSSAFPRSLRINLVILINCSLLERYLLARVHVAYVAAQMLKATDRSEALMTIKRVSGQYFRSYALIATNDVGRRRAFVELVRRQGHATRQRFPGERQSDGWASRPTPRQDAASALSRPGIDDRSTTGE